jgi:hypothetical protein
MAENTSQVAFRLPLDLLKRIDRHAERMRDLQPGVNVTRTDVVRMLLTRALDHMDGDATPRRNSKRTQL